MHHSHYVLFAAIILAYLIGSIPSAIVTCKIMGLPDPRKLGSKNPGATNVLRIGGKTAAIITLLGDVLKAVIVVLIAKRLKFSGFDLCLITFAVFVGHLYPIFYSFKGGKGVATAFGCIISLSLPVGIACVLTWLLCAAVFRYSSLAAIITAALAPIYTIYYTNIDYTILVCAIGLLIIYRHQNNIRNLIIGREAKIVLKKN
jgi:glycerol-3-phosphate acyltransferase PlsY